jgi:transposase-like protein
MFDFATLPPVRYLNNIVEQDHRSIKRRVRASQGFRSFHSAARTIAGIETVNMIRKGQVRWWLKATSPVRLPSLPASSISPQLPNR